MNRHPTQEYTWVLILLSAKHQPVQWSANFKALVRNFTQGNIWFSNLVAFCFAPWEDYVGLFAVHSGSWQLNLMLFGWRYGEIILHWLLQRQTNYIGMLKILIVSYSASSVCNFSVYNSNINIFSAKGL